MFYEWSCVVREAEGRLRMELEERGDQTVLLEKSISPELWHNQQAEFFSYDFPELRDESWFRPDATNLSYESTEAA